MLWIVVLFLGLLWLATFPAGRKVLLVVFSVAVVGGAGLLYLLNEQGKAQMAQTAHEQAIRVSCENQFPLAEPEPDGDGYHGAASYLQNQGRKRAHGKAVRDCELKADPAYPGAQREAAHYEECEALFRRKMSAEENYYETQLHRCFDY